METNLLADDAGRIRENLKVRFLFALVLLGLGVFDIFRVLGILGVLL